MLYNNCTIKEEVIQLTTLTYLVNGEKVSEYKKALELAKGDKRKVEEVFTFFRDKTLDEVMYIIEE